MNRFGIINLQNEFEKLSDTIKTLNDTDNQWVLETQEIIKKQNLILQDFFDLEKENKNTMKKKNIKRRRNKNQFRL